MAVVLLVAVILIAAPLSSPAVAQDCTLCHGSVANAAPPLDVSGNSATTFSGVGAHQSHLSPSTWRAEIACGECHLVPGAVGDPGHIDTSLPAELTWGPLATSAGAVPSWNGTTCSGTYCHGSTLPDGGATPDWTNVGSGEAACGTCHDITPSGMHECSDCHPNIRSDLTFIYPSMHIDGEVTLFPLTGAHDNAPALFSLQQNIPNPFNPTTTIRYIVPDGGGHVALRVYDATGRLVRTLVDRAEPGGEQQVTWNGRDDRGRHVASGVYLYRMTALGFTKTRKMVLLQ